MKKTWIAAGAMLAVVLTGGGEARGQYWLSDRAASEGRGIRVGNFELHPGVGAEFGYDSNPLVRPPNDPLLGQALRLRLTPSISLSTLGAERSANSNGSEATALPTANFRATLAAIYHHFVPVSAPAASSRTIEQLSNLGANAGFRLDLFPGRTWQFALFDDLARVVVGSTDFGVALVAFNRIQNAGGFEVIFAPNGGVLDARLTYTNRVSIFENAQFSFYNFMMNEIGLRTRWRFLPKTALMWEGIGTYTNFFNPSGSATGLFNSFPIRTRFGLNGLLTERVGLLLMVGYEGTYFDNGDNADTPIGQAEVRYIFSQLTSFRLGILRDVQPSFLGNYYIRNQAYASINQSFAGRFYLSAEASGGIHQYGYITNPAGMRDATRYSGTTDPDGRFTTLRFQGTLFGEYRFSDVVGVNATLNASINSTDVALRVDPMLPFQSLSWTKFEAYVGARANW